MTTAPLQGVLELFGPYTLLSRLAVGSVGEVLRATDVHGRDVALKRLLPSAAADAGVVAAFESESELAGGFDHEGIARLIDSGRVDGVAFAAYELVRGCDLRTVLERLAGTRRRLPPELAAWIAARIAEALAHVHGRTDAAGRPLGIVHRDVSPANVVLSFEGAVKLVDFGIARAASRPALTATNEVKGTLRYVSPEQVAQLGLDARSDLFSLGLVLWEMLTGKPAFDGPLDVVLLGIARGQLPPLQSPVPAAIDAVVRKVLAKDREERYDCASKFADALTAAAHEAKPSEQDGGAAPFAVRLARLMCELFPGEVSEEHPMADDKGSSDLDVFEGLAKKSSRSSQLPGGQPSNASGPPPPPSTASPQSGPASHRAPPPPPPSSRAPQSGKVTLLGVPVPPLPAAEPTRPSPISAPPPPPPSKRPASVPPAVSQTPPPPMSAATSTPAALPPPPSRKNTLSGGTSPVALPPPPPSATGTPLPTPGALPPPPTSKVAPPVALPPPPQKESPAAGVEMDWDDDEESTHVFEKRKHAMANAANATPKPAAGVPASKVGGSTAALVAASGQAAARAPSAPPPAMPPPALPPPALAIGATGAVAATGSVPPPPPVPARLEQQAPSSTRHASAEATRPRERDSSGRAGVILGGLALVAVGGLAAFLLWPRTGQLKIDLKSKDGQPIPRAEIFVDGQKRCDTAPCVVGDLTTGAKSIRVIPPGQPFVDAVETVEAGKEKLVFISLEGTGAPGSTPGTAPPVASGGTGIKIASSQPGVKVLVDGKERGTLPLSLTDLSPGDHTIKLDGGDRYASEERKITVGSGEVKDLGELKLKVVKGLVTLDLRTEGADVVLSGMADGKKVEKKLPASIWKSPPVKLPIDLKKETWTLVATKKGMKELRQELDFADGNPEPTIVIDLASDAPEPTAPVVTGPLATGPAPTGPAPTVPTGKVPGKVPGKDPGKEAPAGQGTLNINSIPVSKVLLDGRPIGSTPKAGVSVPAGTHTVTFIKDGERKSVSVTVKAGETKVAAVKF